MICCSRLCCPRPSQALTFFSTYGFFAEYLVFCWQWMPGFICIMTLVLYTQELNKLFMHPPVPYSDLQGIISETPYPLCSCCRMIVHRPTVLRSTSNSVSSCASPSRLSCSSSGCPSGSASGSFTITFSNCDHSASTELNSLPTCRRVFCQPRISRSHQNDSLQ